MTHVTSVQALYRAALEAVDPERLTRAAVRAERLEASERVHLLAIGKASPGMMRGALAALDERGLAPVQCLAIAASADVGPRCTVVVGDHPTPGPRSRAAAEAIGAFAERVDGRDTVLVLISGGASSLAGAPIAAIDEAELAAFNALLLGGGVDIDVINLARRRVLRWGGGRLAAALAPARIVRYTINDVPGFDDDVVGSGPCAPDPATARDVVDALHAADLWDRVPLGVAGYLLAVDAGRAPETPKPDDGPFARLVRRALASNATACDAAREAARRAGLRVAATPRELSRERHTDAREHGRRLARTLIDASADAPICIVVGGEPAMDLRHAAPDAAGGRMQAFALAAAAELHAAGAGDAVTILAAGTDGRDGPTDAAGAVVDGTTWGRIAAVRDPQRDLMVHRSHAALRAADALLPTHQTGTNVADVVIAIAWRTVRRA